MPSIRSFIVHRKKNEENSGNSGGNNLNRFVHNYDNSIKRTNQCTVFIEFKIESKSGYVCYINQQQ